MDTFYFSISHFFCFFFFFITTNTQKKVGSFCGTPEYLAPEVFKREPYGKVVDWWSYGTLVYEMIHGLPPYYNRNREKMYKSILNDKLQFPETMNTQCREFLGGLLNRNPEERLGATFFVFFQYDCCFGLSLAPPSKYLILLSNLTYLFIYITTFFSWILFFFSFFVFFF